MSRERGTGHLFRKPGCKVWRMQYYVDGRRRRESTGTRDKTKAGQLLIARLNAVNRHEPITPTGGLVRIGQLLEDVKQDYINNRGCVPEDLGRRWKHLQPAFADIVADRLTTTTVDSYVRERRSEAKPAANATINRELGLLRHMLNWGRGTTPAKVKNQIHIRLLKEDNVRKGFIEDAAFARLTEACGDQLWLRTFLELGFTYPSRKKELLGLRVKQVNWMRRSIRLEADQTKTKRSRTWVLTERAFRLVEACCLGKGPDDRILTRADKRGRQQPICDMRDAWWAACVKAGLGQWVCRHCLAETCDCPAREPKYRGLTPHDLRRSSAKALRLAGVPESTVMALGGWETASTFRRYAIDSDADQQAAAEALERARLKPVSPPLAPRSTEVNTDAKTTNDEKVH